ncbi:MAG TPA: helix-turn-helix domain-containing protein [Frankiaceae bacterium]|nr:helix-turn-helix domain-containing protein [Frankiaceae bacterium]
MAKGPGPPPGGRRADELAGVAARAAHDARQPASLLGDYLSDLLDAVARDRRFGARQLEAYQRLGRTAAERGYALPALVDLYLSATWRAWNDLPALAGADSPAQLRRSAAGVLRAVDDALAAVCHGYQDAWRAASRAEEALRREFVDDLLTGTSDLAFLLERAPAFGLRLEAPHVVLVASGSRRFVDGRPMVRDVEAALLARAGSPAGRADLLVATRQGLLVCVLPGGAGDDADPEGPTTTKAGRVAELVRVAADRLSREETLSWRLGVSRPHAGAAGTRTGFDEARGALELADRLALEEQIVHAEELLVYQVLLRDREAIVDLVRVVLGPLSAARGGAGPLVETLSTYYGSGGVAAETARRLHLSVRAVTYRLERVRELTGHDPNDPSDRFALEAALHGARALGWPLLPLPRRPPKPS